MCQTGNRLRRISGRAKMGESMTPARATARALLLALFATVAACGSEAPLTKKEYATRLSAACEAFAARERSIGDPSTLPDLVEKGPRILSAFEETILAEVRGLEAPDDLADPATRLVELAGRQRDVLAALVDAGRASDFAKVRTLASRNAAMNEDAEALARVVGAVGCVRD
jgi:hypothetical protein